MLLDFKNVTVEAEASTLKALFSKLVIWFGPGNPSFGVECFSIVQLYTSVLYGCTLQYSSVVHFSIVRLYASVVQLCTLRLYVPRSVHLNTTVCTFVHLSHVHHCLYSRTLQYSTAFSPWRRQTSAFQPVHGIKCVAVKSCARQICALL